MDQARRWGRSGWTDISTCPALCLCPLSCQFSTPCFPWCANLFWDQEGDSMMAMWMLDSWKACSMLNSTPFAYSTWAPPPHFIKEAWHREGLLLFLIMPKDPSLAFFLSSHRQSSGSLMIGISLCGVAQDPMQIHFDPLLSIRSIFLLLVHLINASALNSHLCWRGVGEKGARIKMGIHRPVTLQLQDGNWLRAPYSAGLIFFPFL